MRSSTIILASFLVLSSSTRSFAQDPQKPPQDPQKPPAAAGEEPTKPTRSFGSALVHNLGDDLKHLPRLNTVYFLAGGGALAAAVHDLALGRAFGVNVAAVGHQFQEAVLHVLLGVRRDECALALSAHHQVFGGEFVNRLAHGALAHAESRREVHLARDRLTGLPFAGFEALREQDLYLLV